MLKPTQVPLSICLGLLLSAWRVSRLHLQPRQSEKLAQHLVRAELHSCPPAAQAHICPLRQQSIWTGHTRRAVRNPRVHSASV